MAPSCSVGGVALLKYTAGLLSDCLQLPNGTHSRQSGLPVMATCVCEQTDPAAKLHVGDKMTAHHNRDAGQLPRLCAEPPDRCLAPQAWLANL